MHTEVHMELSKKTTILLSPAQHSHLSRIAKRRRVSLGEVSREACTERYGSLDVEKRLAAVKVLSELNLPVSDPATMKEESTAPPREL